MNTSKCIGRSLHGISRRVQVVALTLCLGLCCELGVTSRAEGSLTEYQVKALFLVNFIKYVDWPSEALASSNATITIGLCGESKLREALSAAVSGKGSGGRMIVIRQIEATNDFSSCQILFIGDSASSRMREILDKARSLPILTVGEDNAFAQNGGIINFVLKNGNVRLEVDLAAARQAGLTIHSRLLAVADVVKGKGD
jgi:YfiR/HmsC-like